MTHDGEMHLPHGSIWPAVLALAIALLGTGIVLGGAWLIVGAAAMAVGLFGWINEDRRWWRDGIGTGAAPTRLGIQLFMSSEVLLFGALFATYFSFRAASEGHWPDQHVELPIVKTLIFSAFLISSSGTIHMAESALKKGNKKGFNTWWFITIVFGAVFLYGQFLEYSALIHEGVKLGTGHFATTFYMITGTHGLHVAGGLFVLIVVFIRSMLGQFDQERHVLPQAAAMYWHFVDAIWIIVFTMLYIVQ